MSTPRRNDRHEWTEARIADATKAATDGQGWSFLANLWKCSTPNALQWCRANVHGSVCNQIGINGFLVRYPRSERKNEYRSKPKMMPARQSNGKVLWVSCQHTIVPKGERPYICGAPTEGNKQFCKRCAEKRLPIKNDARRDSIKTYI